MTAVTRTTHHTFARYTVAGVLHAVATDVGVRSGVWHVAALAEDAQLTDTWIDSVAQGEPLALRILDRPDLTEALLAEDDTFLLSEVGDKLFTEFGPFTALAIGAVDGLAVTVETVTRAFYDDGTSAEFVAQQTLTCVGRERAAGSVTLSLVNVEDKLLNALYPAETFSTTMFPLLSDVDAGRAIPIAVGVAEKLPGVRVTGAAPYRYVIAQGFPALWLPSILTVYRGSSPSDARVVDPTEYFIGIQNPAPSPLFAYGYIEFFAEQRDFSGAEYRIYADVNGYPTPRSVAVEIQALLTAAGATADAASFAAFQAFCVANELYCDCDFGRDGQRTIRAILEDLLWLGRATLTRGPTGAYVVTFDGASAVVATYDEDAGADVEVIGVTDEAQPLSVGVRYRPSPRDPAALQFAISRAVPGGSQGVERERELRYVRRHDIADRCAYYRAQRAAMDALLKMKVYRVVHTIGQVLRVSSREFGLVGDTWRVRRVRRIPGGCEIEATPYAASLVDYVAGTLPGDAGIDYTPDYSSTPPAAPTSLRITAGSTAVAGDGALTARVTVDALPPAANWRELWFAVVHNTTSEIPSLLPGTAIGGGRYGVTLTGLRPGETYKLLAYAVNSFNVQGVTLGTFNATAIGGGAAVTTFVAPGYATLPATVPSIVATQGTGKLLNVEWGAVGTANLREYVLERRVGAGAYAEVWRGRATSYVDRAVSYSFAYQYRVRALDTYGNFSGAYATSVAVTPSTGTVSGGSANNDIGASTVTTSNRSSLTTISTSMGPFGFALWYTQSVAHGLGKIPIATVRGTTGVQAMVGIRDVDATNVDLIAFIVEQQSNTNTVAGDPHRHYLVGYAGLPAAFSVSIYVW